MATLLPTGKQQFFRTDNGAFLNNGYIYTYENGTTTPKATYTDAAETTPQENPIRLNARGETNSPIYWSGTYTIALHDAQNNLIYTVDDYGVDFVETEFMQAGSGAVGSTVQTELRRSFYVSQFGSATQAAVAAANERLYVNDGETVTLTVPSQFATLSAAWSAIREWVISGSGTVRINVDSPTSTLTESFTMNHPYGDRIEIVGDETTPANRVVTVSGVPTFDCFKVSRGHRIGLIAGFRFTLAAKATQTNNATAVLALDGGVVGEVRNCEFHNWYYQISERSGGHIYAHHCTLTDGGDVMVWGFCGGSIRGHDLTVSGASDAANSLGYGFQAEYGATLEISDSTASDCLVGGFAALSNGTGRYFDCVANSNDGSGFVVRGGGVIEAQGSSTTNNTRYGEEYFGGGTITGMSTNTGNTMGTHNGHAYFDNGSLGARIAATGDLRLDTTGANSTFFHTSGGLQFEVAHKALAVNRVFAKGGATGAGVTIGASGSDAVIDLILAPFGPGSYVQINAGYVAGAPTANGKFKVRLDDGSLVEVPCYKA